jgi:DNA-binding winged helix-turn-helix (wHTH) protein
MKLAANAPPRHVYEFGDFRLDAGKRLLWRADAQVRLTPRVFETLLYLVEHHDTVLDKERLMEAVWPDSIVEENNLTQNISTLRRVSGKRPVRITTSSRCRVAAIASSPMSKCASPMKTRSRGE